MKTIEAIENCITLWQGETEDGATAKLLCLSPKACDFLKEALSETLSRVEVKTEFEPELSSRNLFADIERRYGGYALMLILARPYQVTRPLNYEQGFVDGVAAFDDYHVVMKGQLAHLMTKVMTTMRLEGSYECHVDTSPYVDRDLGFWSGLGEYGKHHQLMNETMGAHFNIGFAIVGIAPDAFSSEAYAMTYQRLVTRRSSSKSFSGCEGCNRCVKACPVGICGTLDMARELCLSYLTQTKNPLPESLIPLLDTRLYGCSTCQWACPYTKITTGSAVGMIDLEGLLSSSNKAFLKTYRDTGFAWRGAKVIKRNALIAAHNRRIPLSDSVIKACLKEPFWARYCK